MNKFQAAEKFGVNVGLVEAIDSMIIENRMKGSRELLTDDYVQRRLTDTIIKHSGIDQADAMALAMDRMNATQSSFLIMKVLIFLGIAGFIFWMVT